MGNNRSFVEIFYTSDTISIIECELTNFMTLKINL